MRTYADNSVARWCYFSLSCNRIGSSQKMSSKKIMDFSTLRVSEAPNPLTYNIDVASTDQMVRLLSASDGMLFDGFEGLPNLFDESFLSNACKVTKSIESALRHPQGRIVFTGCGTSGRLAHLFARNFNNMIGSRSKFDYLLAGGDAALLVPQEAAEDQHEIGIFDIKSWEHSQALPSDAPIVLIGISCGLSATYVASMLSYTVTTSQYCSVALGFNPVNAVKHVKVDTWDRSFFSVLEQMLEPQNRDHCVVLNPIVGPETIAGSSRMKGGSATKILVESMVTVAVRSLKSPLSSPSSASVDREIKQSLKDCFRQFENSLRYTYEDVESIKQLIDRAGVALRTESSVEKSNHTVTGFGRILYLGVQAAGLLSLVDASECSPTYGSLFNDVRGFLLGGASTLGTKSGLSLNVAIPRHMRSDKSSADELYVKLGFDSFMEDYLPTLTSSDMVVFVLMDVEKESADHLREYDLVVKSLTDAKVGFYYILVKSGAGESSSCAAVQTVLENAVHGVTVSLPSLSLTEFQPSPQSAIVPSPPSFIGEYSMKLILNAITTGAHIQKGTIYHNRMINLMLTNVKLFFRAIKLVEDISKLSSAQIESNVAYFSILRAIYKTDNAQDISQHALSPASVHVHHAASQHGLVPLAIVLAVAEKAGAPLSVEAAQRKLAATPSIRRCIQTL
jgi:N-acetylmuramic acid 6-phosphate (MurNAc-6-P) etherase